MLATSPVFRGFSINFFPMVTVFHAFLYGVVHGGPCGIARSTPDPYLNYPGRAGCARRVAFLRILTFTGVYDLSRYVERQGQAV